MSTRVTHRAAPKNKDRKTTFLSNNFVQIFTSEAVEWSFIGGISTYGDAPRFQKTVRLSHQAPEEEKHRFFFQNGLYAAEICTLLSKISRFPVFRGYPAAHDNPHTHQRCRTVPLESPTVGRMRQCVLIICLFSGESSLCARLVPFERTRFDQSVVNGGNVARFVWQGRQHQRALLQRRRRRLFRGQDRRGLASQTASRGLGPWPRLF